ncbi:MAG: ATP-binding protein, partial [Chloroflexi bacterium]|nr:ATP-binding protein [Chloroflexota bacterium]
KLRSQTLTVQSNEDDTWIDADRARISQVITNILSNACKYSPEKTEINLICEIDGDRLHLAIVDHGIGMTGEEQQSLFTAFFRADNETTRTVPGTGLGLVIAKSITELHGGEVRLKSRPGVGTTIELWLPGLTAKVTAEELPQAAFTGSRLWPERDLSELDLGAD